MQPAGDTKPREHAQPPPAGSIPAIFPASSPSEWPEPRCRKRPAGEARLRRSRCRRRPPVRTAGWALLCTGTQYFQPRFSILWGAQGQIDFSKGRSNACIFFRIMLSCENWERLVSCGSQISR